MFSNVQRNEAQGIKVTYPNSQSWTGEVLEVTPMPAALLHRVNTSCVEAVLQNRRKTEEKRKVTRSTNKPGIRTLTPTSTSRYVTSRHVTSHLRRVPHVTSPLAPPLRP